MKRVSATAIAVLLIFSTLSIFPSQVKAQETTIFQDDFESYAVGTFPSSGGWELWFDGQGSQYQRVTDAVSFSPTKSLTMWGRNGWAAVAAKSITVNGKIGFETMMRAESYGAGSTDKTGADIALAKKASDTIRWSWARVGFLGNGYIWTAGGGELQPYLLNTWYKIKVVYDPETNTHSVWIDDELKATSLPNEHPATEISSLALASNHLEQVCCFDNVKVFEITPPSVPHLIPNGNPVNVIWRGYAYPALVGSTLMERGWVAGDQLDAANAYYMMTKQDGPSARWYIWIYDGGFDANWGYWSYAAAAHYYYDDNPSHSGWFLNDLEGAEDTVFNDIMSTALPWTVNPDSYQLNNAGTYSSQYNDGWCQRFTFSEGLTGEGLDQWTTNPNFSLNDATNKWDPISYEYNWGGVLGRPRASSDSGHYATWNEDRHVELTAEDGFNGIWTEAARVTYGPYGPLDGYTYPYQLDRNLNISELDNLTMKAVVAKWRTGDSTSLTGWTGIKFDAWFIDPQKIDANGKPRQLVIEMYFGRSGWNMRWESYPGAIKGSHNELARTLDYGKTDDYMVNLWAFNADCSIIGGHDQVTPASSPFYFETATFVINLKSIWEKAKSIFGRSSSDRLFAVALDLEAEDPSVPPRATVSEIRVTYALGSTVYEQSATSKPQDGNSWSNVSDSSSTSGQVMMASDSSSNGGCLFGPYITLTSNGENMSGKPYFGTFRLKVSSNASSSIVASIDVAYDSGSILQSMQIEASDFRSSGAWQDFSLAFTVPVSMTAGLEFRVHNSNNGVTDLLFDKISITRGWNASTLYYEAAYNKLRSENGPWSVLNDPTSLSGLIMNASKFSQNNGWLYGPYINESSDGNSLLGKACVATFRLKVSSNQNSNTVARIDVGYNAGQTLQSMLIKASDFTSATSWQDFKLTFVVPNSLSAGLEFRVRNLNNGIADLSADTITVAPWGNPSVVFTEGAFNKQRSQNDISWHNESDSSSFSGLVMKASASAQNGYCLYGPYITSGQNGQSLLGKPYVAIFRLKVSSNLSPNTVAHIDIAYDAGEVLQSLSIRAKDFAIPEVWQDFQLTFVAPNDLTDGLEFRVQNWNNNVTDFLIDTITVVQGWSRSDVYVEAAHNKQQTGSWQPSPFYFNSSWSKVLDTSSASGLVMKASNSSPRSDCLYGPYITSDWNGQSMLGKPYTATFRLKVSNNTSANGVVYIDIGYNAGHTLQSRLIKANDFTSANTWKDFKLAFIVPSSLTDGLEFRIVSFNTNVTDVYADKITVDPEWNASTTYLESAYDKFQSGSSWSKLSDSSSSSGLVMKAPITSPNGGCLFGPYTYVGWNHESMLGRAYVATFRLKVSSNLAGSDVVSIDVACNAGSVLQSVRIKATDFASSDAWQDFRLTFVVPSSLTYGLEFRITNLNHGTTDIFADYISITQT